MRSTAHRQSRAGQERLFFLWHGTRATDARFPHVQRLPSKGLCGPDPCPPDRGRCFFNLAKALTQCLIQYNIALRMGGMQDRSGAGGLFRTTRCNDISLLGMAVLSSGVFAAPTMAQTALPEITVTAPSPILPQNQLNAASTGAGQSSASSDLRPIAADVFAPVTVITANELERQPAANIGDLLMSTPGVSGSGFAAGANRPVIRGVDNARVRIQENGVGAMDVSDIGEDHGVPIDPLAAERIEIIRGPATLRWGSQAIGGVSALKTTAYRLQTRPKVFEARLAARSPAWTTATKAPSRSKAAMARSPFTQISTSASPAIT